MTTPAANANTTAPVPVKLILRVGAPVLVVVAIVLLISSSHETRTVSEVIDEIHGIALARPQGGLIGSWWVTATGIDPEDGRLQDFKVECGPVHLASRSARVIVNPHANTFRFEMWDVVFVPVPDEDGDQSELPTVRQKAWYVLGPLPYPLDIVPDARTKSLGTSTGDQGRLPVSGTSGTGGVGGTGTSKR